MSGKPSQWFIPVQQLFISQAVDLIVWILLGLSLHPKLGKGRNWFEVSVPLPLAVARREPGLFGIEENDMKLETSSLYE